MVVLTETFGYIASFFVAISLVMSSFLWLRVLNLIGAVAFVVYGALLGSIPVVITNGFIISINIYYLIRMVLRPDLSGVSYLPVEAERRGQLDDFVVYHLEDITSFFPDFSRERLNRCFDGGGRAYLAMKDLALVGFSLVHPVPAVDEESETGLREVYRHITENLYPERSAVIPVDYVVKKYRGLGFVNRLYRAIEEEAGASLSFLLAPVPRVARHHRSFLQKHGYREMERFDRYVLYGKSLPGV